MVHVLAVGTRVREPLQAFHALKRLLSAVKTLVLGQMVLVLEGLRALVALVGTLPCKKRNHQHKLHSYILWTATKGTAEVHKLPFFQIVPFALARDVLFLK